MASARFVARGRGLQPRCTCIPRCGTSTGIVGRLGTGAAKEADGLAESANVARSDTFIAALHPYEGRDSRIASWLTTLRHYDATAESGARDLECALEHCSTAQPFAGPSRPVRLRFGWRMSCNEPELSCSASTWRTTRIGHARLRPWVLLAMGRLGAAADQAEPCWFESRCSRWRIATSTAPCGRSWCPRFAGSTSPRSGRTRTREWTCRRAGDSGPQ